LAWSRKDNHIAKVAISPKCALHGKCQSRLDIYKNYIIFGMIWIKMMIHDHCDCDASQKVTNPQSLEKDSSVPLM